MAPRPKLSEQETRDLILDEAQTLFLQYGYKKTTIADIADACGFSPANVHRFFGTKGTINEAIAERMLTHKIAEIKAAIAAERTAPAKLAAAIRTVHTSTLETFTETKRVHDLMECAIDERWTAIRRYRTRMLSITEHLVAEGVAAGDFNVPDVKEAALGVHMSMFRLCHPVLVVEMLGEPDEGSMETLIRFILRGLGVKDGAG